jgi:hypothetical protein
MVKSGGGEVSSASTRKRVSAIRTAADAQLDAIRSERPAPACRQLEVELSPIARSVRDDDLALGESERRVGFEVVPTDVIVVPVVQPSPRNQT